MLRNGGDTGVFRTGTGVGYDDPTRSTGSQRTESELVSLFRKLGLSGSPQWVRAPSIDRGFPHSHRSDQDLGSSQILQIWFEERGYVPFGRK